MKKMLLILLLFSVGCAANFASDEIIVLSENKNTVTILGRGDQRVLNAADALCKKYEKSARLVKSWGGTRLERSEWQFDCL